jgi:excisionase family DNA binding protein
MRTFSVSEAAQELGISIGTVYGLCSRRRLRHERHGLGRGVIRIPEDAIEEYRRGVTVSAAEATPAPPPRRKVTLKNLRLRTTG